MMTPTETVRLACISVGIDPERAEAAAIAHARLVAANPMGEETLEMVRRIRAGFDFTAPPGRRMTATEVLHHIGVQRPTRSQQTAAGVALIKLTGRRPSKSNGRHYYTLPVK